VPWLIRYPDGRGALARSHALTSHLDLLPTVVERIDRDIAIRPIHVDGMNIFPVELSKHGPCHDWLLSISPAGSNVIRTADWCLRQSGSVQSGVSDQTVPRDAELFVRPDDRWEANDVAKLCPDVVEQLGMAIEDVSR
jgi:arylsulfatase A-like enzyme